MGAFVLCMKLLIFVWALQTSEIASSTISFLDDICKIRGHL
jgi:hypothetical protein